MCVITVGATVPKASNMATDQSKKSVVIVSYIKFSPVLIFTDAVLNFKLVFDFASIVLFDVLYMSKC